MYVIGTFFVLTDLKYNLYKTDKGFMCRAEIHTQVRKDIALRKKSRVETPAIENNHIQPVCALPLNETSDNYCIFICSTFF